MRQPPAPSPRPAGRFRRSVLPVPPLGGTPRLPALDGRLPRKRAAAAGPRRRSCRTVDQILPLARQAGDRTPRGARPGRPLTVYQLIRLSTAVGSTPVPLAFATGTSSVDRPLRGSRSVVGPPVARGADSRGIQSLVDPARERERTRPC